MGEYAIRNSDKERVKIGVCEAMMYLRYTDKDKVTLDESSFGHYWRLPWPDENHILPGDYENPERCELLINHADGKRAEFNCPELADDPGTIQLTNKDAGLLVNLPCHHGEKLPSLSDGAKVFFNGRSTHYALRYIRSTDEGAFYPVITCRHCGKMWRSDWQTIKNFIPESLWRALQSYITAK